MKANTSDWHIPTDLLTVENAKTTKGESLGYLTGILYLAPAMESGVMDTCPKATLDCRAACLFTAGRGAFTQVRDARINKTLYLFHVRQQFLDHLAVDIEKLVRRASRESLIPAVRINGTSDLAWIAMEMSSRFPGVQFYDYTKLPKPELRISSNYHLTFSFSGNNLSDAKKALAAGINVAVVFDTRKGQELPQTWQGCRVVDGDLHDLRFLDPKGVVIGLRAKGDAKKQKSPFVVLAA